MKLLFTTKRKTLTLLSTVAIALLVGVAMAAIPHNTPVAPMGIAIVTKQDLLSKVSVAGTILPNRRALFTPPYNAYIKKLHVTLGQEVKEGAPVVTLTQSLRGAGEEAFPLRAPFSGRVVQVLRSEGEFVEAAKEGNGIVRIDDVSKMFVHSDVPEVSRAKLHPDQEVFIKANAVLDRSYHGVIRSISLAAKDKREGWSRTGDRVDFEVRIEITDKDERLLPGMSAIIDIVTESRKNVMALPHEYLSRDEGKFVVTLESGEKREVQVGLQNESIVEILSGVKENDRVKMVDFFRMPGKG